MWSVEQIKSRKFILSPFVAVVVYSRCLLFSLKQLKTIKFIIILEYSLILCCCCCWCTFAHIKKFIAQHRLVLECGWAGLGLSCCVFRALLCWRNFNARFESNNRKIMMIIYLYMFSYKQINDIWLTRWCWHYAVVKWKAFNVTPSIHELFVLYTHIISYLINWVRSSKGSGESRKLPQIVLNKFILCELLNGAFFTQFLCCLNAWQAINIFSSYFWVFQRRIHLALLMATLLSSILLAS